MDKKKQQIFVFGSNPQGRHKKGAALHAAKYHGAIYGQSEGLQGNSYAIITKELRKDFPKITLKIVKEGVDRFLEFAKEHPEMEFNVTPIGCGLAGFKPNQIKKLFLSTPPNVFIPEEFE